jgi:hypothetical protein
VCGERFVIMRAGPAHPGSRAVRPRRRAPGRASSIPGAFKLSLHSFFSCF